MRSDVVDPNIRVILGLQCAYKSWRSSNLPTDHNGVNSMDKLFQTRCMASPNDVEQTRVWTDYSNISSKH